jgi:hypothetical protein
MPITNQPYHRNVTSGKLSYDVLASKGKFYYTVEMLGGHAISCDCKSGEFNKHCKHRDTAEQAEAEFQALQGVSRAGQGMLNRSEAEQGFSMFGTRR